jgi:hypothetical protein
MDLATNKNLREIAAFHGLGCKSTCSVFPALLLEAWICLPASPLSEALGKTSGMRLATKLWSPPQLCLPLPPSSNVYLYPVQLLGKILRTSQSWLAVVM